MTLLAPWWLLLLGLAAAVIALHAQRRRGVRVASLQIWARLERVSTRRTRLHRPAITPALVLQLLVILFCAVALARPQFDTPNRADHAIYVVDASGSMRTTDREGERFARAVAAARARIDAGVDGVRVSVVTVGSEARIAVARQERAAGIAPILATLAAGDASAAWPAVPDALRPLIRDGESLRLIVLTDAASAAAGMAAALPDSDVEIVPFGDPATANAGLAATLEPKEGEPGTWVVEGTVLAPASLPVEGVAASFRPEGGADFLDWGLLPFTAPDEAGTPADPESTVVRQVAGELVLPGPGIVRLALPADAGPQDGVLTFIVADDPRLIRILLLGNTPAELVRALQATRNVEILVADSLPADDATFDLVVVSDVALDRRPMTNTLWVARAGLAGEGEPGLAGAAVTGWDAEHELSRGVDWRRLDVRAAFDVPRLDGAAVLAEAGGVPIVQARTTPTGREIRIAAVLDGSAWTADPGFPVFIANLVDWLGVPVTDGPTAVACVVGVPCPIEPRRLAAAVTGPGGETAWRGSTGAAVLPGTELGFVPQRAGLYGLDGGSWFAVNPPGLAETPAVTTPAPEPETPGGATEFWRWLLLAALVALLAEAWLAGRGSERFLRRSALVSGTPLAGRRRLVAGLAIAGGVLLAAAVAALPLPHREPALARVLIAGDDLGARDRSAVRTNLIAATVEAGPDALGRVATGLDTRVAIDLGTAAAAATAAPAVSGPGANLEGALRLAAAMLPGDRDGRIVLAADGNETAGHMAAAVPVLQDRGIAIDAVPLSDLPPGEVLVETVAVSTAIRAGDRVPLDAVILSARDATARVTVAVSGAPVMEEDVALLAGRNRIEAILPPAEAGEMLVEVAVTAAGDLFAENNRNGVLAAVAAAPRILVIAGDTGWGDYFAEALAVQGLSAEVRPTTGAPWYLSDWLAFDAIVLMNVPAIALDTYQQELIETAVSVHGRGLLILGGENSFGPGGYYSTAFERMSPLSARVPHESPLAAMAFVLDRSGSMRGRVEDRNRLDVAKEATLAAVNLLDAESQVTIVAFDTEPRVVVPLGPRDGAAIADALAPIQPGGGTAVLPGLAAGFAELQRADAEAKHIVVMTDGLVEQADFEPLFAEIRAAGITVSVVAIGDAADASRLEPIVRLGGGSFHQTRDFRALPGILAQEALLLSSDPVTVGTTPVEWRDRSADFLAGLPDVMPPVENYVATTAQPGATVHLGLIDAEGEPLPLLASWRYGAGRVLAFATHGAGSGTQQWLTMPEYPLLWAQTVRHFLPGAEGPGLHVALERRGDTITAVADLLDGNGAPLAGREVTATRSDRPDAAVTFREASAGRYTADLGIVGPGTLRVVATAGNATTASGIHVAYPARLDFGRAAPDRLAALALATGGTVLADATLPAPPMAWFWSAEWIPWALAALVVFLAGLVVRYAPLAAFVRKRTRSAGETAAATSLGKA